MSVGAEQLEARIARLAERMSLDSGFDAALRCFCTGTLAWFREDLRRIGVFGDLGQIATVGAAFAFQGDDGVTLTRLIKFTSDHGLASPRRVRAICDNMARLGLAAPAKLSSRREKPLRVGGWLEAALLLWMEIRLRAVMPWLDSMPTIAGATLARFFAYRVALDRFGFDLARDSPEVRFFLEHTAGYAILLELVLASHGAPDPSRKRLARAYGVSRPHIAGLLTKAEKKGWLAADHGGPTVLFTAATRERLRQWIARELALAVIAFQ